MDVPHEHSYGALDPARVISSRGTERKAQNVPHEHGHGALDAMRVISSCG